jgi:pimeloyl-ACP methyl ester carboxylesterase
MQTLSPDSKPADAPASDHVVVLIPGFLGFNKFGDHAYFAQTVGKALANALVDADGGRVIPVVAVDTLPAGTLAARQQTLIGQLEEILAKNPRAQFHLVGHSTGGLDAELLARTPRPGESRSAETERVRHAIRSVITLASPLAGTSLASSPAATFFAIDSVADLIRAPASLIFFRGPSALLTGAVAAVGLFTDVAATDLARNMFHDSTAASYLSSLAMMRSLVDDLAPEKVVELMEKQTREDPALPDIRRARFLTIAPGNVDPTVKQQLFDLFQFFYSNTKDQAKSESGTNLVERALEAKLPTIPIIGATPLPPLDAGASDAIVNTLRQVAPGDAATIEREVSRVRALVVADHIDVVGYYPGKDGCNNGFLNSGAKFRDAQFTQLYDAIASEVEASIRSSARTSIPEPVVAH